VRSCDDKLPALPGRREGHPVAPFLCRRLFSCCTSIANCGGQDLKCSVLLGATQV
jgi:hypothetical protein